MVQKTRTVTLTITDNSGDDPLETIKYALGSQFADVNGDFSFKVDDEGELTDLLPEVNVARLLELQGWVYGEHLKKEAGLPSEWDQSFWVTQMDCGTSCCIAGKVAIDAGASPRFMSWDSNRANEVTTPTGEVVEIAEFAQTQLGLTYDERTALFDEDNDYEDIVRIIKHIINGRYR